MGGDLELYTLKNYLLFTMFQKTRILDIKRGSVVVMDSHQYHRPQHCGGHGQRTMIIVHFVAPS